MRTILGPLTCAAVLTYGAGLAMAASPTYCALYAKEFVKHAAIDSQGSVPASRIHDRAYHKCLNMDDEPLLPTAYVDPGNDRSGAPFAAIEEAYQTGDGAPQGDAGPEPSFETTAALEPEEGAPRSGHAMGSPEWRAWCSRRFPNSFDPETGTVVPYKTGVRTVCR